MVGLATVFGAGGGTSSYEEAEAADVIVMWGSNARNAHPIFFHHVLKAVNNGAKLYVVDPRRCSTAQFADRWLGIHVGTDIALSNTIAREIIHAGLAHTDFIARATTGYEEYAASVEEWTLERGEQVTGVPAEAIRELAHAYATAKAAQLCWTLGITEHHNGVDNVLALCNLALLTGQVGRYGAGLSPLRGQNNVQGGGDMGALPNKLPGFQDVVDEVARKKFETLWNATIPAEVGWHLTEMFEAMERGDLRVAVRDRREPGPVRGRLDARRAPAREPRPPRRARHLPHQDRPARRRRAPGSASWCEAEGRSPTPSAACSAYARRSTRRATPATTSEILLDVAARLGHHWHYDTHEDVWDELRSLSPMHAGMSWKRLEELGGIQWPCFSEDTLEPSFLHGRLWADDPDDRGRPAPFSVVLDDPPVEELTRVPAPPHHRSPARLVQHRRAVGRLPEPQPTRRDDRRLARGRRRARPAEGEIVAVSSARGTIEAPVQLDRGLRPGWCS